MSLEVDKSRYYDPRLIQQRPKFAINQGALSISSSPFQSLSATSAQMSFQLQTPSQNTFLDRRLPLTASVFITFSVTPGAAAQVGDPLVTLGKDASIAPYPLHSLFSTIQMTLGDTQISANLAQSREILLRLLDSHKVRRHKTCASALDTFADYADAAAASATNTPFAGYENAVYDEGNGASPDVVFVDPRTGTDLAGAGTYRYQGTDYTYAHGVPQVIAGQVAQPVFLRIASTELLQISPFQWLQDDADSTGLFGLQTLSLVINIQSPQAARLLRQCTAGGRAFTTQPVFWTPPNASSCFSGARVDATFLTPSLSVPLAPRSVVPWFEVVTYTSQVTVAAGAGSQVSTQTLTLPVIPDLLVFAVQPTSYASTDATYFVPVSGISLNYSNFSGLLSSLSQSQLYRICAENGLNESYNTWRGKARTQRGIVQTVAGPLILQPSKDITLSDGEAPGLVGNYTVSAQLTLDNSFEAAATPCTITVLCINSGFLVTERGQSRIVRGPITQADVLSAPVMGTHDDIKRMIGSGVADKFGHALSRSKDWMSGVAQTVRQELPKAAKAVASSVSDLAHRLM